MPNLLNIANAYEIETCTIKNNNEIEKKIKYLLSRKKPIYCEVLVSDKQRVVPKLESGRAIHDLSPLLSRKEMNLNMIND
jgi:thiamine pyrophosphate-dependent acetolactate synthase large subunit-like protein